MMTPHAQNLALARLDGWKPSLQHNWKNSAKHWERNGFSVPEYDLLRYTESLDALRPIELKLTDMQKHHYAEFCKIEGGLVHTFNAMTVPVHRRAEAILRAVGKYT